MDMEKIFHKKRLVAIKIRKMPRGSTPVIPPQEALQVLTLKHPKGGQALPHAHMPKKRVTHALQECLVVLRGKLRATLYDARGKSFYRSILRAGDTFIVLYGIHGIEYLEDSEVIEVKNGPFINDKKMLSS